MNLDEMLKKLSSLENGEELAEAVMTALESEKERGIASTRKKDKDVLKLKATLKDLGYDKETFDDLDSFVENIKKTKDSTVKSELTINTLNDRVNELILDLKKEREAKEAITTKAKVKTLEAELQSTIGDKFFGAKYLIKDLISSGSVDIDEDGNKYFKDGDTLVPWEKGIESLKEKNKDILKVSQSAGSGDIIKGKTQSGEFFDKSSKEILDELF
jgi:hypothetical protein